MKNWLSLIVGLFFTLGMTSLQAQTEMSLLECIIYGQENALDVESAEYNIEASKINLTESEQARYPNLSGSTGLNWNFGRTIDPTTNEFLTETFFSNNFGLNTGVVLFNGSRIKNSIKQNKLTLEAAKSDILGTQTNVALSIASAYVAAVTAQENLKNAQARVTLTKSQLEQIDKLISAGTRPRNDRLDILSQIALDEQQILGFQNMFDISILNLKQAMNYSTTDELQIAEIPTVATYSEPDDLDFEQVYNDAANIYLAGDAFRSDIADVGIKIAKSGNYPSIFAGANLNTVYSNQGRKVDGFQSSIIEQNIIFNGQEATIGTVQNIPNVVDNPYFNQIDENISYGFGINANIPIYNNGQTKANIQRAKLNKLQTENTNARNRQNLRTTVSQVLVDAQAAKKQLAAAQKALDAQKAAYDNAQKRFELGAVNTYELINSKNLNDSAEINYTIAKFDYLFKLKILDIYRGKPVN